ncbi:hypothetical protein IFM47457_05292 [Aspergillus lentulus]|nr:hypothetical protein IFM47457_05292 [Aspergillus lentulus]
MARAGLGVFGYAPPRPDAPAHHEGWTHKATSQWPRIGRFAAMTCTEYNPINCLLGVQMALKSEVL